MGIEVYQNELGEFENFLFRRGCIICLFISVVFWF